MNIVWDQGTRKIIVTMSWEEARDLGQDPHLTEDEANTLIEAAKEGAGF